MPSLPVTLASALSAIIVFPLLVVAGFGGTSSSTACAHLPATTPPGTSAPAGRASATPPATTATDSTMMWDDEQQHNAQTIVTVGLAKHVPAWGWVIAIATALRESGLHDQLADDNQSRPGLFGQGRRDRARITPARLADPAAQARAFYDSLLKVPGWQQLPITQAASSAQHANDIPDDDQPTAEGALHLVRLIAARQKIDLPPILQLDAARAARCLLDEGDGLPDTGNIKLPNDFTLPLSIPAPVAKAITWGLQQRGTPYSYGGDCTDPHGADPDHRCDCSSLMQMAYRAGGITLPRTTLQQQVDAGTPVPDLTQLLPGDLVFIPGSNGTAAVPRHVGMYLGRGLILQAPHTGTTVRLSRLTQWAPQIAKVRRIVTP